jgi:hypothetical protein
MKRILLLSLLLLPIVALAQYPTFSNKQKLGVQTTGDGLIYRGNSNPNYNPSNINNAYFYLDTTLSKLYLYSVGTWQQVYPTAFDTSSLNIYLKISDTTAMLLPYFRDSDTTSLNLISRFALKLNISDTVTMLTPYLRKADTISLSNRINLKLNISDTTILSNRITTNANNIIIINNKLATKLDTIYTKFKDVVTMIENKDTINIGSSLTEGYGINIIGDSINVDTTIIFTQSDTITLSNRIDNKLSLIDTASMLLPYLKLADTTSMLAPYFRDSDTTMLNLTTRFNSKLNTTDTVSLSDRINLKLNPIDTISLSNRIDIKLNASDTVSLSNRINTKLDTIYVNYPNYIDTITNKDTIQIAPSLVLTEGFGINIIADSINIDSAVILATQQKQIAYVKNQSGVTMYKGQAVYSSGSSGDNKLVTLASSNTEQASSKTFGIVETDSIPNGGHGYIITFGVLSGFNTNALTEGLSVYLSSTPGQLTSVKPQAPLHIVTIGVCIRQQQNTGSIFVKIQNGFEFDELHDVRLTDLVDKSSIYYNLSEKLWRDTTAVLLVSDTASMLSKYVNTYSNQTGINGDKTFNNVVTIDSATVTGKLLVNTNISDAVKISSNTNSTNLELANNSGNSVFIKSSNRNMTLQTDSTALMYLNGETNRVGILTMSPEQALEVAGTIRVDSLGSNTLTPTKLVGANDANDLSDVKLGTGLFISNDTLKLNDNIINLGDTATLLRADYYSITTNKLVWTEGNKKLIPYFTQVYRNGQLLKLIEQYLFSGINNDTITLQAGNYKLGDNITVIAIDNIVALSGSGGMITLQGDVTGSGTSSITTTIGANKVTNTMLAGSISDSKLNTITTVGKVSNSATTATDVNTANHIVLRDASGNFSSGTITASLNGNANTSTTLATGRTIGITGDLTYTSPSFNGSTNVTAVGTLANSGVTANTYTAATVTVDAKGRITSASNNTIPTVNDGTLTMAVSGNGLTGSQTFTANQSSAATFTVTSNATSNNTANTIVYRDANRDFIARNITASNFYGNATTAGVANNLLSVTGGPSALVNFSINTASLNGVRTVTIPDNNVTMATTNLSQTFGGTQTFSNTISGSINGNAATVTTNANLTGDVTSTGNSTTLASVGTAGTYRSVTTDIKGRVTAGTNPTTLSGYGITDAVPSNRTITINGTAQDLSTNRTFNVGTVTGTGTNDYIVKFTSTGSTIGNSVIQESSGNIGIGTTPTSNLELARGKFITLNSRESGFPEDSSGIMIYETGTKTATDINFGAKIMYNSVSDNFEIKMKNFNGTTLFNPPVSISIPRGTGVVNIGTSLAVTGAITEGGNNVLTNLDTASLSSRIDGKVSLSATESIGGTKTFNNLVNITNQMTISGSVSGGNQLLGKNTSNNGVADITLGTGLSITSNVLNVSSKITDINTSQYSITSTDLYIDNFNNSSTTIILPLAGLNVYRELKFKNSSNGALIANGNIVPLSGSGTTTTILPATNAKWCTLVSDGSFWRIMQSN